MNNKGLAGRSLLFAKEIQEKKKKPRNRSFTLRRAEVGRKHVHYDYDYCTLLCRIPRYEKTVDVHNILCTIIIITAVMLFSITNEYIFIIFYIFYIFFFVKRKSFSASGPGGRRRCTKNKARRISVCGGGGRKEISFFLLLLLFFYIFVYLLQQRQ